MVDGSGRCWRVDATVAFFQPLKEICNKSAGVVQRKALEARFSRKRWWKGAEREEVAFLAEMDVFPCRRGVFVCKRVPPTRRERAFACKRGPPTWRGRAFAGETGGGLTAAREEWWKVGAWREWLECLVQQDSLFKSTNASEDSREGEKRSGVRSACHVLALSYQSPATAGRALGRRIVTAKPPAAGSVAEVSPPQVSMAVRTIASPKPLPPVSRLRERSGR